MIRETGCAFTLQYDETGNVLPFIPCNLPVVHNAFRKGLTELGLEAEELVLDLFYYLKASPGRKEDCFDTQLGPQLDEESLIKHVQSRWLSGDCSVESST